MTNESNRDKRPILINCFPKIDLAGEMLSKHLPSLGVGGRGGVVVGGRDKEASGKSGIN